MKMPNGTEVTIERELMSQERFVAICVTIGAVIAIVMFFGVFIFG